MNITIAIQKELKIVSSGVYMIYFSNGRFYIGASKNLYRRIKTHVSIIRKGFKSAGTPKGMKKMMRFEGTASFILLEAIDLPESRYGLPKELREREKFHKIQYLNNKFLLNRVETIY